MQRLISPAGRGANGGSAAPDGRASNRLRVLQALLPYVWPHDRPDLKTTVVVSLALMLVAKLVTVAMPFTFKWATDALVQASGGNVPASQTVPWLVGAPMLAILLYGLARVAMSLLVQVREGMFAKVALHAVRKLALNTFEHMHRLSLRFHLERKTGGLTRVLERGRLGIENITRMTLMTFVPTVVEFALVLGVLMLEFDWRYAAIVAGMIALYLWFTVRATDWRIKIRRTMNESDTDANTKAIDSLLNYETVKYFGAEEREAARYDRSVGAYADASIKSYTSLAVLNAGQAVIFAIALTACMLMAGYDIAAGTKTVGHFVMVNALMLQLFIPLNFMGMVYREIRQSVTDIERMMDVLAEAPEVADRPGAMPLDVTGGTIRFEDVKFCYEPARHHTGRPLLRGAGRQDGGDRRPLRSRQVDGVAHPAALLRRGGRARDDRRAGHPRRHAGLAARGDRRRAAGHRAVQRHHPLQHPLRPPRCHRRGGAGGGPHGADRRRSSAGCPKATAPWWASGA